jgi:hypothetical protein
MAALLSSNYWVLLTHILAASMFVWLTIAVFLRARRTPLLFSYLAFQAVFLLWLIAKALASVTFDPVVLRQDLAELMRELDLAGQTLRQQARMVGEVAGLCARNSLARGSRWTSSCRAGSRGWTAPASRHSAESARRR